MCVYACWLMKNLCLNLQKTTFGIEFIIMIVKNEKKINKIQVYRAYESFLCKKIFGLKQNKTKKMRWKICPFMCDHLNLVISH